MKVYKFITSLLSNESNGVIQLSYSHGVTLIKVQQTDTETTMDSSDEESNNEINNSVDVNDNTHDSLECCFDKLFDENTDDNQTADRVENVGTNNIDDNQKYSRKEISIIDIFKAGKEKLMTESVCEQRESRKKRLDRDTQYYMEVNHIVKANVVRINETVHALSNMNNTACGTSLSFRNKYKLLLSNR